jgi:hypothetical protein
MVGTVVAASVFAPWLFSGDCAASSADDIQEAIVNLFLFGITDAGRTAAESAEPIVPGSTSAYASVEGSPRGR